MQNRDWEEHIPDPQNLDAGDAPGFINALMVGRPCCMTLQLSALAMQVKVDCATCRSSVWVQALFDVEMIAVRRPGVLDDYVIAILLRDLDAWLTTAPHVRRSRPTAHIQTMSCSGF